MDESENSVGFGPLHSGLYCYLPATFSVESGDDDCRIPPGQILMSLFLGGWPMLVRNRPVTCLLLALANLPCGSLLQTCSLEILRVFDSQMTSRPR